MHQLQSSSVQLAGLQRPAADVQASPPIDVEAVKSLFGNRALRILVGEVVVVREGQYFTNRDRGTQQEKPEVDVTEGVFPARSFDLSVGLQGWRGLAGLLG